MLYAVRFGEIQIAIRQRRADDGLCAADSQRRLRVRRPLRKSIVEGNGEESGHERTRQRSTTNVSAPVALLYENAIANQKRKPPRLDSLTNFLSTVAEIQSVQLLRVARQR